MISIFEQTDEALCALAASGDREAEECLAARYGRLVRVCARPFFLAGGDSEDLIQEGMIGLLSAIRGFTPEREANFRTYAETCIRNRLLSAVRAAGRDKHSPLNHSIPLGSLFPEASEGEYLFVTGEDPEDVLIGREEWQSRVGQLRAHLSSFESTVLTLYLEGLSNREIAQQLGRPSKSIDNAIQRIRGKVAVFFSVGGNSAS